MSKNPICDFRCRFTLVPVSNQLIAIGGCGNDDDGDDEFMDDSADASVELYDPDTDTWKYLPALPRGGRSQHAGNFDRLNFYHI